MMDMPQPTAGHKQLHKLAGNWVGEETMHPSPWDPAGHRAEGKIRSQVSIDGFIVAGNYEQSRGGAVTFRGHAVYWYDTETKKHMLHWWDSMGIAPNVFEGGFQGDVLTMTTSSPMGHHKLVYDLSKPNEIRSKMEMSQDGKKWAPMMDGSYRREK